MRKASASLRSAAAASDINFILQVWKEDGIYVAYAPELDVSSCGNSVKQAKARLREALSLFLEEAASRGTLQEILSEAGFAKHGKTYRPRRVLVEEKVRLAVPTSL